MNSEKKFLTSFDKSYYANIFFKKPDKYREIESHSRSNKNIITIGSNYSYAPMAFDKNSLAIDLSSFDRIIDFNLDKKEITVEAGLKIYDFLKSTLSKIQSQILDVKPCNPVVKRFIGKVIGKMIYH